MAVACYNLGKYVESRKLLKTLLEVRGRVLLGSLLCLPLLASMR